MHRSGGENKRLTAHSERPAEELRRLIAPQAQPPRLAGDAPALAGKTVLIVDDDIRNIFALTSALEQQGMSVLNAENGVDAVEMLRCKTEVDIVLMDVMMPERDGHDTIRIIRKLEPCKDVPIIAVTAKAMKGDREKCIEAGASDYIAKPLKLDELVALMGARLRD